LFEAAGGNRQSPINIQSNEVAPDPKLSSNPLRWSYPVQSSSIVNTGHGWKVNVEGEGSVLEGGPLKDKYQLAQYHCHWGEHDLVGSEHLVDDQPYAAEVGSFLSPLLYESNQSATLTSIYRSTSCTGTPNMATLVKP